MTSVYTLILIVCSYSSTPCTVTTVLNLSKEVCTKYATNPKYPSILNNDLDSRVSATCLQTLERK